MFEDAGVDVAILQSTYLKEWYTTGFNTMEKNAKMAEKHPGKVIVNGRFDPREGEAGLRQLEEDAKRYNLKGVKLYTAEWYNGSRGWRLDDDACKPFFEKCKELGIKNVHAHKGPTIWPLDKDSFDHHDVDAAATDNPELNFIIEHAGIPRIDDFCFMATQEPNVYAGIAVVLGALMHARPRFFARVMGELLFWVGEDKMLYGSDYAIWEPKWQIEGFLDWNYPDDVAYSDYPAVSDGRSARSSVSTPPSCTESRCRRSSSSRTVGRPPRRRTRSWSNRHDDTSRRPRGARRGHRPRA